MSSQGSPTLDLDVRSRRTERRIAMLILMTGAASPWLLQSGFAAFVLIAACAGAILAFGFWRAGWLGGARAVARITWQGDGRWFLTDRKGSRLEATLQADSRRGPGCVWLRWQVIGAASRSMLLLRDDLAPHELRRLLVRLAIDGPARPPTGISR